LSNAAKSAVHHRILASGPSGKSILIISSRLELVIFDCDGVLVDSEPIINRAHAEVLTACGYPVIEPYLVKRFCGMSDAEMLGIIGERGRRLPPSYTERVAAIIEVGFCGSLTAIEGVAETLASLTVLVCFASSSAPEQIRRKS
jgi:phosphoglycolate phosphatase